MIDIYIHSKLTGELVDSLNMEGDTDIDFISAFTVLKEKGYLNEDYYFYFTVEYANYIFDLHSLRNRCGEALEELIDKYRCLYNETEIKQITPQVCPLTRTTYCDKDCTI